MQIRFDGPPEHVSGRFIEVEDDQGRSIKVGEWRRDGEDWLLVIPGDQSIREVVEQVLVELDGFLALEWQGLDWENVILPTLLPVRLSELVVVATSSRGYGGRKS